MIDTAALKNSILDLAFQGKLTSQDSSDGSAEDLYNEICDEKNELIKLGKIKKSKIIPIKDEDIPYSIPDNWKWIRWGDLSEKIQYGYNAPAKSEGRIKMVRISDIQDNTVLWETVPYCEIEEEQIADYLLRENDILFARTGGTVGKSYIVSDISEDAVFAGYLIRTSYSNKLCSQYMKFFMESKLYWKQLRNGTIATAQPNCNGQTLSKMMVPLPPFTEQLRIVATVENAFEQIDEIDIIQEQYSANLKVLKSKIIDAGIQGKLTEQLPEDGTAEELMKQIAEEKKRLIKEKKIKATKALPEITEDEIPFEIPDNWKYVRIGDVCELNPKNDLDDELEVSFIPMACVKEGYNNKHSFEVRKWGEIKKGFNHFQNNDVGIAKITPCFQNRKSVVFRDLLEGKGAGTTELSIVRGYEGMICPDYLLWFFKSNYFIGNGIESFTGVVGQQRIHKDYLKMCVLPLPPYLEQLRIADKINSAIAAVENM